MILQERKKQVRICIIGCGVSGLTCGVKLLEEGYSNIQIFAKHLPPNTTSDVAPAIWRPDHVIPLELTTPWAMHGLKVFTQLAKDGRSGVRWVTLTEVYKRERPYPKWMDNLRITDTPYFPQHYPCAHSALVPLIDTSIYMPYLMDRFKQLGGNITKRHIQNLHQLTEYDYIINCSGLGARHLVKDKFVYPIKGQIVRIKKPKELDYGIADHENEMTYVYPRYHDCIIGSTAEENQWELSFDKNAMNNMLERATTLCPAIKDAEIIGYYVGLRPARKEVRLGIEPLSIETMVVHNYGHGGYGFTLSWGCANEVAKLLQEYAF